MYSEYSGAKCYYNSLGTIHYILTWLLRQLVNKRTSSFNHPGQTSLAFIIPSPNWSKLVVEFLLLSPKGIHLCLPSILTSLELSGNVLAAMSATRENMGNNAADLVACNFNGFFFVEDVVSLIVGWEWRDRKITLDVTGIDRMIDLKKY